MCRLALFVMLLALLLGASGQEPPDPATVLIQARERLLADVARLPRYTCVQTINRQYLATPFHWQTPNSCNQIIAEHDKRTRELTVSRWDRLRLDVAVIESQETYSWVGMPRLGETTLKEIAGKGAFGSGDFGPFITAIFGVATINFDKEEVINRRRLLQYSYAVPEAVSKYEIRQANGKDSYITAYRGTFLLDPQAADLVRLTVRTAELMPETGKCQAISEVDYGRMVIHTSPALIPQETRLRIIGRTGEETLNVTSYANCHEYGSKSVLHFEPVEASANPAVNQVSAPPQNPFPPGLHFDLRIVTPIDSETAAGGDPLDAVLRSTIRDKEGNVLAPAGARLYGRLLKVEHQPGLTEIAVALESIDIKGTRVPLSAVLDSQNASPVHYMGHPRGGELVRAGGFFRFYGDRLKVNHLDSKGITIVPRSPEKDEPD